MQRLLLILQMTSLGEGCKDDTKKFYVLCNTFYVFWKFYLEENLDLKQKIDVQRRTYNLQLTEFLLKHLFPIGT